jgi:hypothetical protein
MDFAGDAPCHKPKRVFLKRGEGVEKRVYAPSHRKITPIGDTLEEAGAEDVRWPAPDQRRQAAAPRSSSKPPAAKREQQERPLTHAGGCSGRRDQAARRGSVAYSDSECGEELSAETTLVGVARGGPGGLGQDAHLHERTCRAHHVADAPGAGLAPNRVV